MQWCFFLLRQARHDAENAETLLSFTEGIEHFRRLFDIEPLVIAHDLHPDYLSTAHAERTSSSPRALLQMSAGHRSKVSPVM